jgi:DNA-binding HxlR family transcriptional regulator
MNPTGNYHMPVKYFLESNGNSVYVIDARKTEHLRMIQNYGKEKSDTEDASILASTESIYKAYRLCLVQSKISSAKEQPFNVKFLSCPVQASLGTLGKKWALIILRNIAVYRVQRFNEMLRFTPDLNRRILSIRLRELNNEGLIESPERNKGDSRWYLTEKGRDVLPILMSLVNYGIKWHASTLFSDEKPRILKEIFDSGYIESVLSTMIQP